MKTLLILTKRNSKLFFKDKGMFFSSLITPAILLVLYVTFLSNVYRDSFLSALPEGFALSDSIIDGVVGGLPRRFWRSAALPLRSARTS